MLSLELVVHDSLHQTTLAHTSVSDNNQLEQVVLGVQSLVSNHFICYSLNVLQLAILHYDTL